MKKPTLEGIAILEKPKQKITIIVIGAGEMAHDYRESLVTRGRVSTLRGDCLLVSRPGSSKQRFLEPMLRHGAIVLKGHVSKTDLPVFVGDVPYELPYGGTGTRTVLYGDGGNFVDAARDGGRTLLANLREHLVLHSLPPTIKASLSLPSTHDGFGNVLDAHFGPTLVEALGPPMTQFDILPAPPQAPERKALLTAVMKNKLMAREGKPAKPIFKIFDPGGAGTWLLCSLEPDGDTLWAVCDIGFGCVEYGTVSLEELETTRSKAFNLHMERDKYFDGAGMSVAELTSLESLQQRQEVKA